MGAKANRGVRDMRPALKHLLALTVAVACGVSAVAQQVPTETGQVHQSTAESSQLLQGGPLDLPPVPDPCWTQECLKPYQATPAPPQVSFGLSDECNALSNTSSVADTVGAESLGLTAAAVICKVINGWHKNGTAGALEVTISEGLGGAVTATTSPELTPLVGVPLGRATSAAIDYTWDAPPDPPSDSSWACAKAGLCPGSIDQNGTFEPEGQDSAGVQTQSAGDAQEATDRARDSVLQSMQTTEAAEGDESPFATPAASPSNYTPPLVDPNNLPGAATNGGAGGTCHHASELAHELNPKNPVVCLDSTSSDAGKPNVDVWFRRTGQSSTPKYNGPTDPGCPYHKSGSSAPGHGQVC